MRPATWLVLAGAIALGLSVAPLAAAAEVAQTAGSATAALQQYMAGLEAQQAQWRRAAALLYAGESEQALAVLQACSAPARAGYSYPDEHRLGEFRAIVNGWRNSEAIAQWYLDAEAPALAVKVLDEADRKQALDFQCRVLLSRCLVEAGEYRRAGDILQDLLKDQMAEDWRRHLNDDLNLVRLAQRDGLSMAFIRGYFVESRTTPFCYQVRPGTVLALWRLAVPPAQAFEKLSLLAELVGKSGNMQTKRLVVEAAAECPEATPEEAAGALLEAGNMFYALKEAERAISYWRRAEGFPKTTAWGKAVFNIGLALEKQGGYDEAMPEFSKLLAADVNDREPGAHIMETYRNYRPRAQWEIGNCLFAKGEHARALAAYRTAEEKVPVQSWCGNELAEWAYRYALYQGLCLEYLGRYDEALAQYLRAAPDSLLYGNATVHIRLADLYEAAGQTEDLRRIARRLPSRVIQRVLEIRGLEERLDWPVLVALLRVRGTVAGPEESYARLGNWEAVEAARLLARHPDEAVPLLQHWAGGEDEADLKWVYYALGLCGTPAAVAFLEERARQEENSWWARTLVYALSLAGQRGQAALDALASVDPRHHNLKVALQQYRDHTLGDPEADVRFPAIPKHLRLPSDPTAAEAPRQTTAGPATAPAGS